MAAASDAVVNPARMAPRGRMVRMVSKRSVSSDLLSPSKIVSEKRRRFFDGQRAVVAKKPAPLQLHRMEPT